MRPSGLKDYRLGPDGLVHCSVDPINRSLRIIAAAMRTALAWRTTRQKMPLAPPYQKMVRFWLTTAPSQRTDPDSVIRASKAEEANVKFVLVNGRTPDPKSYCAWCSDPVGETYVRELSTCLSYCDHQCYLWHCSSLSQCSTRARGRHDEHSPCEPCDGATTSLLSLWRAIRDGDAPLVGQHVLQSAVQRDIPSGTHAGPPCRPALVRLPAMSSSDWCNKGTLPT